MHYVELANWNGQVNFYWNYSGAPGGWTLIDAINQANIDAMGPGTPRYPMGHDDQMNVLFFSPQECLAVHGYGAIHFNEFNHANDTW